MAATSLLPYSSAGARTGSSSATLNRSAVFGLKGCRSTGRTVPRKTTLTSTLTWASAFSISSFVSPRSLELTLRVVRSNRPNRLAMASSSSLMAFNACSRGVCHGV